MPLTGDDGGSREGSGLPESDEVVIGMGNPTLGRSWDLLKKIQNWCQLFVCTAVAGLSFVIQVVRLRVSVFEMCISSAILQQSPT